MDFFYISVISAFFLILIIILTFIGLQIQTSKGVQSFPPSMTDCPDYWQMDMCGNCIIPSNGSKNSGKLYDSNNLTINSTNTAGFTSIGTNKAINFNAPEWTGRNSAICTKRQWTSNNGIFWDGVTNYNNC